MIDLSILCKFHLLRLLLFSCRVSNKNLHLVLPWSSIWRIYTYIYIHTHTHTYIDVQNTEQEFCFSLHWRSFFYLNKNAHMILLDARSSVFDPETRDYLETLHRQLLHTWHNSIASCYLSNRMLENVQEQVSPSLCRNITRTFSSRFNRCDD